MFQLGVDMLERCLVVDDHEMIRETIAIMATTLGFKDSITASDGADAISKIYHFKPSFIITDLQMAPIDGLEMLRLIRSGRYGLPHNIPIIILTANASEDVIAQCIAFDVDAFLVKPVDKESLQTRINQLTQQAKSKKSVNHYFEMYQQDPAKSTFFQINGTVAFSDETIEEFNLLEKDKEIKEEETEQNINLVQVEKKNKKEFIKWQERFSVGQDDLDESNKNLLNIINDTYNLILDNNEDIQAYEEVAERFNQYINHHLKQEEYLLNKYNYPRLKIHKDIHIRLVKQANFVVLKCQADPVFYKTDFFKLLRFWWVKHVVQEDTKYLSLLSQNK